MYLRTVHWRAGALTSLHSISNTALARPRGILHCPLLSACRETEREEEEQKQHGLQERTAWPPTAIHLRARPGRAPRPRTSILTCSLPCLTTESGAWSLAYRRGHSSSALPCPHQPSSASGRSPTPMATAASRSPSFKWRCSLPRAFRTYLERVPSRSATPCGRSAAVSCVSASRAQARRARPRAAADGAAATASGIGASGLGCAAYCPVRHATSGRAGTTANERFGARTLSRNLPCCGGRAGSRRDAGDGRSCVQAGAPSLLTGRLRVLARVRVCVPRRRCGSTRCRTATRRCASLLAARVRVRALHSSSLVGGCVCVCAAQSRLPEAELARIWGLADLDRDGRLTLDEFAIAMHLVTRAVAGNRVPDVLPASMLPPFAWTDAERAATAVADGQAESDRAGEPQWQMSGKRCHPPSLPVVRAHTRCAWNRTGGEHTYRRASARFPLRMCLQHKTGRSTRASSVPSSARGPRAS